MLIEKGEITRNIDPSRLREYTEKGYKPVVVEETPAEEQHKKNNRKE